MDNAIKQGIKEEITQKVKKDLKEILQKYELKQQFINKLVSEITILSILAIDNHLSKL